MEILRKEHPNPQWMRENWRNLNGEWEFDFDFGCSAIEREIYKKGSLSGKINVPFCPQSELSGINYKDFINGVCYRKEINLSETETNGVIRLHFGAVDYESYVYINGKEVYRHLGGYSSFSCDITKFVNVGTNEIFVIARDNSRTNEQPSGKQSRNYASRGCYYTRTIGIWQTVWLEFLPKNYIVDARYTSDIENSILTISGTVCGKGVLEAKALYNGQLMGMANINVNSGNFVMQIKLKELHLWEVGNGRLYDLELTFDDDCVVSYFGMREIKISGKKVLINNKPVFQRLVLDQGFYPDGIYTAKSDEMLERDIDISLAAGFNGARLHQKVFEKRFIYHCDRKGYIIWGEHASWGVDYKSPIACENFINEWIEIITRDFNSPAIIGWCPFNETWNYYEIHEKHRILETVYNITKAIDNTRFCIDTSGNYHSVTDVFDVHDYEQDVEKFTANYENTSKGVINDYTNRNFPGKHVYKGEPLLVSEYGGIKWGSNNDSGWGYGNGPETEEEFIKRYKGLTDALLDNSDMMGFCYTQLYDIEQEINGLYTYDRKPKFDMDIFKEINTRKAKYEE